MLNPIRSSPLRSMRVASILCLALVAPVLGCDEKPHPPEPAFITFVNQSNSGSTYDLVLDGVTIGAISPFQKKTKEVAPGKHNVKFKFSNSGSIACQGDPVLQQGEHQQLACKN